jgi:hypothetical protein
LPGCPTLVSLLPLPVDGHCAERAFPAPVTPSRPVLCKLLSAITQAFFAVSAAKLLTNRGVQRMCWCLVFVTRHAGYGPCCLHCIEWQFEPPSVSVVSCRYGQLHWSHQNSVAVTARPLRFRNYIELLQIPVNLTLGCFCAFCACSA